MNLAQVLHGLIVLMHAVQHMHLRHPDVWVGCTRGWHHTCDMTTVLLRRHEIIVRW